MSRHDGGRVEGASGRRPAGEGPADVAPDAPPGLLLDEGATEQVGRALGRALAPPAFVALHGPLGAGKSVFARALARGRGVPGRVPSPTYPLLIRHDAGDGSVVVHMDLYRLDDAEQIWELGWEDLPAEDEVVVVEWAERAGSHLPDDHLRIELAPVPGDPCARRMTVRGATGGVPAARVRAWAGADPAVP